MATASPSRTSAAAASIALRKHDLEEFTAVVERHGLLQVRDLEMFAAALRRSVLAGFKPCDLCRQRAPGLDDDAGQPADALRLLAGVDGAVRGSDGRNHGDDEREYATLAMSIVERPSQGAQRAERSTTSTARRSKAGARTARAVTADKEPT